MTAINWQLLFNSGTNPPWRRLSEAEVPQPDQNVHVMRPGLLLAPYHGTEGLQRRRGFGVGKKLAGSKDTFAPPTTLRARSACFRYLLINAAVAEGITSIATVHDSFYVCRRGLNGSAGSLGSSSSRCTRSMTCCRKVLDWARRDLKEPKGLPDKRPERGALDIEQVPDAEYAFA